MKLESTLLNAFVVINGCTFQVQSLFSVDNDLNTMLLSLHVVGFIEISYDVEAIVETTSAAAGDADPKDCAFFVVTFLDEALDFFRGNFSYRYAHKVLSPKGMPTSVDDISLRQKAVGSYLTSCDLFEGTELALTSSPILYPSLSSFFVGRHELSSAFAVNVGI